MTTTSDREDRTREHGGVARPWQALSVCLVGSFMALLDVSIVNVALPSIREGLHTSQSALQWVLSGYSLAFGLLLVPAGRLGDARSRRAVFMGGLAVFALASAACGLAQSEAMLVAARLVQGAAGGTVIPQVSGFIQEMFQGAERGRAFGLLGAVVGVSTAVGPLLGGLLIQAFGTSEGWRWVFYVNVPIGVVAILLARRLLPAPDSGPDGAGRARRTLRSFDPVGVLLLGCGVVLVLLPLIQEQDWKGAAKWLLVPVGVALLAAFVWWERRFARSGDDEPLVDLGLFQVRSYSFGTALGLFYFAGFTSIFFTLTLFLQNGERYSALAAGLAVTPFAVGSGVAAAIGGRFVTRAGRPLVVGGLVLVLIGLAGAVLAVTEVPGHNVGWVTAGPLLLAGLGSGLVITPNQTLTLSEVPVARAGSASGVVQTGQRIGAAVGVAAVGSVFFARLAAHPQRWSTAFRTGLLVTIAFALVALAIGIADVLTSRRRGNAASAR